MTYFVCLFYYNYSDIGNTNNHIKILHTYISQFYVPQFVVSINKKEAWITTSLGRISINSS